MNRILLAALLEVAGTVAVGARDGANEKVVFEEHFTGTLGKEWSWTREEPGKWRIDGGALVLHTSPGHLYAKYNDSKNVLLRALPKTEHPLAIDVFVEGEPKVEFEHAGIVWYVDDDNYVALFQENLKNQIAVQMVTEKEGRPLTNVVEHGPKGVWLRLLIAPATITGQYRSSEKEPWRDVGKADIPATVPGRVGITSGGAPRRGERHVRFRDFRILEIVGN
jgi:regulation of enolase protein 1 (concanavalin A-like superfamily)